MSGAEHVVALVQRLHGSEAVAAAEQLWDLAGRGPQLCAAILDAGGVAALSLCLVRPGGADAPTPLFGALSAVLRACGRPACEAAVGAGAVQALVAQLSGASNAEALRGAAVVLANIASCAPALVAAAAGADAVSALLRCLSSERSPEVQGPACTVLGALLGCEASPAVRAAVRTALVARGGVRGLARCLRFRGGAGRSSDVCYLAIEALRMIALRPPAGLDEAYAAAGVVPALVECLQDSRSPTRLLEAAVAALCVWSLGGSQRCQAVVAAGGVAALAGCLLRADCEALVGRAATALILLDCGGDFDELIQLFEGPSTLEHLLNCGLGAQVQEAAAIALAAPALAAAPALDAAPSAVLPRPAAAAVAAAGPMGQVATPPRVCAAPGCGATTGLRRCAGCATVRYCSEACSRAHWREHRGECRRLRAERAAAVAEAPAPAAQT